MPKEEKNNDEMLEELRQIRTLLTPKPAPPAPARKGLWGEFMDFISKYKIMGLAIAFIIGVYLGELVKSLVNELVMPVIGLVLSGANLGNLSTFRIPVPDTPLNSAGVPTDLAYKGQLFGIGPFLVALITFIIVAFVVFILVKVTKRWGID